MADSSSAPDMGVSFAVTLIFGVHPIIGFDSYRLL
jgi:hypothetical protein